MVRVSLQQSNKDDLFSVICTLDIDLNEERDIADNVSQTSQMVEVGSVASTVRSDRLDEQGAHVELPAPTSPANLLALLGNVLLDPTTDVSEKGSVLEIIAGVAMHNPTFIRRHCLEFHAAWMGCHEAHRSQGRTLVPLQRRGDCSCDCWARVLAQHVFYRKLRLDWF